MYSVNADDKFASLVLYAASMYEQYPNDPKPPPDPRIERDGWKLTGYILGNNFHFEKNAKTNKNELMISVTNVISGYIAERITNPGEYFIALRGTKTLTEALEEIHINYIYPWSDTPDQAVFDGFYKLYESLKLITPYDTEIDYTRFKLADAIARFIGTYGQYTISGHSLGAAMATYLIRDIYDKAPNGRACLFASPKTGNQEFVTYVDQHFRDNVVINYINDIVPRLPYFFGEQLPNVNKLIPIDKVTIHDSIICNHALLSYIALLNRFQFFNVLDKYGTPEENETWNDCLQVIFG
ncbi:lipase family protein [Xenorhabdus sp. SGI246]|uniref:lipase family protein n=1 Tax=Xenorhabdus sp. SGI246 TaxID=3158263 RepID=UPI00349F4DFC